MATYKVLQDIEAEDKLVGPLTLRQCIYAAIAAGAGWLSYLCIIRNAWFGVFFFLPFIAFGVFFAFPWRKEQSTEVWALAKVRFALKPRKRIWDQSGVKNLVAITAPRQVATVRRRSLSEVEVRSRLKALADTVDSRGWAVKNVPLDLYLQQGSAEPVSDRLISGTSLPTQVLVPDAVHSNDMFDMASNPIAQQFEQKISAAATAHRQQLVAQVEHPELAQQQAAQNGAQNWYAAQPVQPAGAPSAGVRVPQPANPTAEEEALSRDIKQRHQQLHAGSTANYGHMRVIQPLAMHGQEPAAPMIPPALPDPAQSSTYTPATIPGTLPGSAAVAADPTGLAAQAAQLIGTNQSQPVPQPGMPLPAPMQMTAPAAVTPDPKPVILELANNNDLDVATLAREAKRQTEGPADEVVVNLH